MIEPAIATIARIAMRIGPAPLSEKDVIFMNVSDDVAPKLSKIDLDSLSDTANAGAIAPGKHVEKMNHFPKSWPMSSSPSCNPLRRDATIRMPPIRKDAISAIPDNPKTIFFTP